MGLGDDILKVSGFGENIVVESTPIQPLELFVEAFTIAAENGWLVHQHSVDVEELETHTTAFERVNEIIPIADMHWNLSHVQEIDAGILQRLNAIGAGVAVQNHYYHGSFALGRYRSALPTHSRQRCAHERRQRRGAVLSMGIDLPHDHGHDILR